MKKLLVLLLCALAVFAIVSCKNDPKVETFKVTFDSQGGSAVAAATVEKDAKVEKPADPTKLGAEFGGWFTEAACENAYNFDTAVTKDFTLYAKWTETGPFTVSFDSVGGSKVADATVEKDAKVAKPEDPTKLDVVFGGWYTEATYENRYDFDAAVTKSFTLYAKWVAAPAREVPTYKATASRESDRFQFQWIFEAGSEVKPGDVISFKYKSNRELDKYTNRGMQSKGTPTKKFVDGAPLTGEPDADGWYTFSYTVPNKYSDDSEFTSAPGIAVSLLTKGGNTAIGDYLYIKDLTYNEKALTITADNLYPGAAKNPEDIEKLSYFRLIATKGGAPEGEKHNYDFDKFSIFWNPNVEVNPGDVVSITFKAVRKDELTAGRPFTYSIRGDKKWFSEVGKGDKEYPQFWSTFDDSDCDGWITATYVFPEASAETKEKITYPATFRIDFRDEYLASPAEGRIADILYITKFTITSGGVTTDLVLDQATISKKYACPTIEEYK